MVALPGALLFATGCLLFATGLDAGAGYVGEFLVPTLLTGTGVGSRSPPGAAPPWPSCRARFATGSAVLACLRQVGAVLGIAFLVAVLGAAPPADPLAGFTNA